jgi:hypothetical protein
MRAALALALIGLGILATLAPPLPARELYPGQYDHIDLATRQWFRSQKSPKTGMSCCDESDGTYAEEQIREGIYWTRCAEGKCPIAQWTPVPDDVVIREPNRNGAPVLWWRWEGGAPLIYCYAPGPLM